MTGRKKRRFVGFITAVLLCAALFSLPVCASNSGQDTAAADAEISAGRLADELGAGDLLDDAAPDIRETARENGLSPDLSALSKALSPAGILDFLTNGLYTAVREVLSDFAVLLGIVMIAAAVSACADGVGKGYLDTVFGIASSLCIAVAVFPTISRAYSEAAAMLGETAAFVKSTLPVMAAVLVASGAPVSGAALPALFGLAIDVLSQLNTSVFLPLLNVYLALCLAASVGRRETLGGLVNLVQSVMTWGIGLICTLLTGLLAIQRLIVAPTDNVAGRTVKFAVSSAIPVVGSMLRESLDTVLACVEMVKSAVGIFAGVMVFYLLAPMLLRLGAYLAMLRICSMLASAAGDSRVSALLKNLSGAWTILLASAAAESVMMIVSCALLVKAGGG